MAEELKKAWYVLRAISGKEAKVKEVLDGAIRNTGLGDYVFQVLIPTEKVIGDTQGDSDAAHTAGIDMCHVTYGFGQCKDAELSADSFSQLTKMLIPAQQ